MELNGNNGQPDNTSDTLKNVRMYCETRLFLSCLIFPFSLSLHVRVCVFEFSYNYNDNYYY